MSRKVTQKDGVKKRLVSGKSITPIQALNMFGCFRLAAVIHKLKKEGMAIYTSTVKRGDKSYASYSTAKPKK